MNKIKITLDQYSLRMNVISAHFNLILYANLLANPAYSSLQILFFMMLLFWSWQIYNKVSSLSQQLIVLFSVIVPSLLLYGRLCWIFDITTSFRISPATLE